MATPKLHSFQYKLDWAGKLMDELERHTLTWFNGKKHFSIDVDPDPQSPGYYIFKVSADDIPADPYSLLIGDIIQNLRSSLDHLVFELASVHTKVFSKEDTSSSQFPVVGDESSKGIPGNGPKVWASNVLTSKLKCVSPAAQSIIEGVQPYQLGAAFRDHPLWWLTELSNIDKHRKLHIGAARVSGFFALDMSFTASKLTSKTGIAKHNTEIARAMLVPPPKDDSRIQHDITAHMTIAFGDDPVRNMPVTKVLSSIRNYIESDVVKLLLSHI